MTSINDIFSPVGPIAEALVHYERRDGQLRMAQAAHSVIEKDGVLLAEAGTGTGKTLAYLVPAILSNKTVIISTGTKNLQEQVFFRDIDFLERALGHSINAVYLKGQDNYVCLRRLRLFLRSPKVLNYPPERAEQITNWVKNTTSGDRMELSNLPDDDPLWREICSTRETRMGGKCPFGAECFVSVARQQALQAKVIVVNHYLYFADLATRLKGGTVLPSHEVVIFDEAHTIENIATEFFSTTVSSRRIDQILEDTNTAVLAAKLSNDPAEGRRRQLIEAARVICSDFFSRFPGPRGREQFVPEEINDDQVTTYHRLDSALDAIEQSLRIVDGRDDEIDHAATRITELRDDLARVIISTAKGYVHWIERKQRSVILGASPIDVSTTLRDGIFFNIPSVIFTSATLSAAGDFSFLKSRLGLDFDVTELSEESPFDYQNQACLFLPKHLPDPRKDNFVEQAVSEISDLISLTQGGAFVLCTSIRNMKMIYDYLDGNVPGPLLLQGKAPKTALLEQFISNRHSTLCATTSFWHGVDIPGDALRLVIIDKLPFTSPADPLETARIGYLREAGHNPFTEYQVPTAALALKQGFGRLIRTRNDRGIVAILDSRLHTMSYAKGILESLPSCPRTTSFSETQKWWEASQPTVTT